MTIFSTHRSIDHRIRAPEVDIVDLKIRIALWASDTHGQLWTLDPRTAIVLYEGLCEALEIVGGRETDMFRPKYLYE